MSSKKTLTQLVMDIDEFILDYHKLLPPEKSTKDLSIWKRLKVLYYVYWKYPRMRKKLEKRMYDDILEATSNPSKFVDLMTQIIVILVSLKPEGVDELQTFMDMIFARQHVLNPIKITHVELNNDIIRKCKFQVLYLCQVPNFYKDKVTKSEITLDIADYTCSIETTIFDTEDYENYSTAKICKIKRFDILANGRIANPNYAFDSSLEVEELKEFSNHVLFIVNPFSTLIFLMCTIQFIIIKTPPKQD